MTSQTSNSSWATLAIISLGMLTAGLLMMSMPPMILPISRQMKISGAQVAFLVSSPFWIFMFFSLPVGLMADRWNLKYISGIGLIMVTIFAIARSFTSTYGGLMAFTILFSIGYTVYFLCVPKIIRKIFTAKKIATASGIYLAAFGLGAAMGISLSQPLFGNNWQRSFFFFGSFALIVTVLWWILLRDSWSPAKATVPRGAKPPVDTHQWEGVIKVFRLKTVWLITAIFFAYIGARSCWGTFGFPYLVIIKGVKESLAGYIMMMDNLGYISGTTIVPYFSDRLGLRRPVLIYFSLMFSVLLLIFTKVSAGPALWIFPFLIGLCFGAINPLVYVIASEAKEIGPDYVGSAVGVILSAGNLSALVMPTVMGKILGSLETVQLLNYQLSWISLAIITGGMIFTSGLLIKETGYRAKNLL